jgi:hypothetical protein
MHRRENRSKRFLQDRAREGSRDSACVQAEENKPGEARPFFPSGLPTAQTPSGQLHRKGEAMELMLTHSHEVTFGAEGICASPDGYIAPTWRVRPLSTYRRTGPGSPRLPGPCLFQKRLQPVQTLRRPDWRPFSCTGVTGPKIQ